MEAVSTGLSSLARLLFSEVNLSKGVYKDVLEIKDELESIQSFLKDADSKADLDYSVREWVIQVREVAYSIEDVIDEYILEVANDRHRNVVVRFFSRIVNPRRKLKIRYELDREIQRIKESVRETSDRNIRHGLVDTSEERRTPLDVTEQPDPRVSKFSLFTEEEVDVFMMESDREMLITLMNKEVPSNRIVVSVVGMGGLGKTTLAKKIYDIQIKTGRFYCYAWIAAASRSFNSAELLMYVISQFYKSRNEPLVLTDQINSIDELVRKLRDYLKDKRYFVVFDDVWNTDFWRSIKHALPDTNNASRIIITTRHQDVALSCQESSLDRIHQLSFLPEDKAWELFCKKAFQSDFGGLCPPELEDLSRLIVKRCGGLPLAVSVIGGMLLMKNKSVSQWKIMSQKLMVYSERDHLIGGLSRILLLSFDDLPYNLKSCFLYIGIFPEYDYISCNKLVKLWIAEGFVKEKGGRTLEEVAYEYLDELIRRNLVYVAAVKFDGKPRCCRVHDMMREIIMLKSKELSFYEVLVEDKPISVKRARRVSIQCDIDSALKNIGNSMTRSIFVFKVERLPNNFMATVCADFKLLKVLDSQDAPLENLPKEVGNLFHLRYLSIRGTKIKKLPESIGKLHNLETLDMKYTHVHELPTQISGLFNLRHLLAGNSRGGVKIQEGFGCLEALQKLYYVEANHVTGLVTKLRNLRRLRKLGIMKLMTTDSYELCLSIDNMPHLQSLHIASSDHEMIDLQSVKFPPSLLHDVCLKGRLVKLPDWVATLQNLAKLCLHSSMLVDDPLKVLQALPQLSLLGLLDQAYDGAELYFEAGGFQQLKRLELTDLKELSMMKIDKGALPILEELKIGPSPKMKEVPSNIQCLRHLATLTLVDMPKEFIYSMLPHEGQDFHKVAHIPLVLVKQWNEGTYNTHSLSDMRKEYYS